MQVEIQLLGGFEVRVDGQAVPAGEWRRRHAAGLVKLLAISPGRALHREQVIDAIWPGVDVDEAGPRLHKAAHFARRSCGHQRAVVLADDQVRLFPDDAVAVDALAFEELAGQALAVAGSGDAAAAATAADLYTGDLLPQDLYEPWAEAMRERLRLLHLELLRRAQRWEAVTLADPADEDAHLEVIRKLADGGERRQALRQFERMERALRRELGLTPGPAAIALRDSLMSEERPEPAPRQRQPPLLGRGSEIRRAEQLLERAGSGRGSTLIVSGPAGIGKTSFLAWVEGRAAEKGWRTGSGVAAFVEGAWPYAPVLEAFADLCRRHPALLDGLADAFRVEIERALTGAAAPWTGASSHQRLFVSAAELMHLAAAGEGAVLLVDDVHEADEASLRLLHFLARSAVRERVLIVLGQRPWPPNPALANVRESLLGRASASVLELRPLDEPATRELVTRVRASTPEAMEAVVRASGGVPFAALELARAAAAEPIGNGRTPVNALALRGVPADVIESLRRVAVLGNAFDTDEFVALSGLDEDEAYSQLDTALAVGSVVRTGTGYRFRHALVRDGVLDGLPPHRLTPLHRSAAESLQLLGASPARIGRQLLQAGDASAAAPFLLQAARTEAAVGAYRDALQLVDAVRNDVPDAHRAELLALRADLLMAAGDGGALGAYRDALDATDDPAERRRIRPQLARAATVAGDFATAKAALEGMELQGDPSDIAILLARGNTAYFTGDLDTAAAAAAEARRRLALGGPDDWRVFDLISLQGLVAHNRGEWFQRLAVELRNVAERPDLALSVFDSHLCVAEYLLYGPTPYAEVLALGASLRDSARRSGVLRAVAFATALRGEAALLMGDLDLADTELREAAALHHDIDSSAGEAHSLQRLAEVHLARGERHAAMTLLHRALPLARWSSIASHLLQRVHGSMITAAPDPEAARAAVDRAVATFGTEDACSFCNVMLEVPAAVACADVGDVENARRHLALAERSAALWEGTAWQAALLEARAHVVRAEGDEVGARRLIAEAAELFESSGQPLDADRCRAG